ncbi:MAG TPA: twitching motility protein PilT [Cytophagales bacterium]|nr:twitching motility protein PilT [Cytophagales bacterium]
MPAKYDLPQISSLTGRKIFFDANVLIYLFWPTGSQHWENRYSNAYGNLLTQGNELVVDHLVISETINVAIRAEYRKHLLANTLTEQVLPFKTFRNSAEGQSVVNDVYLIVKHSILDLFTIVEKNFTKADIESFLTYDTLDFNDKGILAICKENDFVLLTNDKDFNTTEIDILTANSILLQS